MKCYVLYEINPGPNGYEKRIVLIRECKKDLKEILTTIKKSNINFEEYLIEEVVR